jgi:hypothetical protein
MSKDGKTIVAESENIKPKEYFNNEFKEEGEYFFSAQNMHGGKEKSLLHTISKQ